jgi:hypothetical protein
MSDLERIPDWPPTTVEVAGQIDLKAWAQDFRDVYQISEALSKTPFVPREMLGKQADVAAAIMKGRELGLDPFDALGSIYIVHGRVGYYAEFMRRRIIQAGHSLRIIEQTDSRCVIEGVRKDNAETHRATFTAEQARKAGIEMGKYPTEKLVARATSRLCKQAFPDVLSGSLIAEDLIDGVIPTDDTETPPAATTAAKPALARKRASKPAKAAATQPPAAKPIDDEPDDMAELLGDDPADEDQLTDIEREADQQAQQARDKQAAMEEDIATIAAAVEPITDLLDLAPPPEPEPEPITDGQLKKLMIRFRERGLNDRDSRLDFSATVIGRPLTTAKELTCEEANRLLDTLEN